MQVTHATRETNIAGITQRIERGYMIQRTATHYRHVKTPVVVPKPRVEDINNLVVVHDIVEEYA